MPASEAKPAGRYRICNHEMHEMTRKKIFSFVWFVYFVVQQLPQLEPALKNHLGGGDNQKHRADDGVEPEEREVDPVQTAAARDPVFQHETADDDEPANEIRDAEAAQQSEREQQP